MSKMILITKQGRRDEKDRAEQSTVTKHIHEANDKLAESFQDWVRTVGDALSKAQFLLSVNRAHNPEQPVNGCRPGVSEGRREARRS